MTNEVFDRSEHEHEDEDEAANQLYLLQAQYQSGYLQGMYKCHDAFSDSFARLRQSLEDVWAIEYTGTITKEKQARVDTLVFAINTLNTLEDMFQGEYEAKLVKADPDSDPEDKVFTTEEFLQHLEDLENE